MMLARARPLGRKAPTCAVARAHLQILTRVHILETAGWGNCKNCINTVVPTDDPDTALGDNRAIVH